MIIFNWQGLFSLLAAVVVGGALADLLSATWPFAIGGVLLVAFDLWMRAGSDEPRKYYWYTSGGHLSFIPVWLFGVAMAVGGLFLKEDPRAKRYGEDVRANKPNDALARVAESKLPGAKVSMMVSVDGDRCFARLSIHAPDISPSRRVEAAQLVEERFQSRCAQRWFLYMDNDRVRFASLDGQQLPPKLNSILPFYQPLR